MKGAIGAYLLLLALVGTGWVLNLVKLSSLDFEPPYKAEVFRVVGLAPPIGMVVGWFNFDEESKEIKE
jgi:hypothetical protein